MKGTQANTHTHTHALTHTHTHAHTHSYTHTLSHTHTHTQTQTHTHTHTKSSLRIPPMWPLLLCTHSSFELIASLAAQDSEHHCPLSKFVSVGLLCYLRTQARTAMSVSRACQVSSTCESVYNIHFATHLWI